MSTLPATHERLRRAPQQERSREKLRRVLDAAEEVLATEGAGALSAARVADAAGVAVGSLYRYFPDKEAIVEALAVRYWSDFEDLVAKQAAADAREPLAWPLPTVIRALADGFRERPGFLALWFGGLRTERVRDITRPARDGFARSVERMLGLRWPDADAVALATVSRMVVLLGDGILREAFRLDPAGNPTVIEEGIRAIDAYIEARLGSR
jgi:AcrR family transcriptional regulator